MAYFDFEPDERFRSTWVPVIDVYERPGEIIVRVELPGVDKADVRIRWRANVLEITGIKRNALEGSNCRYLCVERESGRFRREIAIGTSIDLNHSEAELRNGLLKIRLPKITGQAGDAYIPIH